MSLNKETRDILIDLIILYHWLSVISFDLWFNEYVSMNNQYSLNKNEQIQCNMQILVCKCYIVW